MRDILDLDRYPLDREDSPEWLALIAHCKADLAKDGMFNLTGLMHPAVAAQAAAQAAPRFETEAFRHERSHNIYFSDDLPLPEDHPAMARTETSNFTLCGDQLLGSPMDRLYRWLPFARFLAEVMDQPALYIMDDTMSGLNCMGYGEGQGLNWHFDRSEFTTTLLLQAPEAGGEFVYRSDLRSEDDPNYEGVAALLRGQDPEVQSLTLSPGTLNVFKGKNTPHRVVPTSGEKKRIICVFSFYARPGVQFSDAERIGFYGRAR